MRPLHVGTCGWSYKDWSGVFYPDGLSAGKYLAYYAERYPVVEVDSAFYRSPARKTVECWRDRTPPGFGFSLKVPQAITHEKVLLDCGDEVGTFLTAARVLGDKLLCCVLQFGYFNRGKFASLNAFLERLEPFLAAWPADVPVGRGGAQQGVDGAGAGRLPAPAQRRLGPAGPGVDALTAERGTEARRGDRAVRLRASPGRP
jgi:uncharacterized protein YecE (DUF72 family)